jgi:hypothetical protein
LSIAGNQASPALSLSNLLLVTFFDDSGEEIPVSTSKEQAIELFIPRDVSMLVPPMNFQNVTSLIDDPLLQNHQFNLHFVNITQINPNLSISVHFELYPLDPTLGYMLIYKLDDIPQLNTTLIQIDDWAMLCPRSKEGR